VALIVSLPLSLSLIVVFPKAGFVSHPWLLVISRHSSMSLDMQADLAKGSGLVVGAWRALPSISLGLNLAPGAVGLLGPMRTRAYRAAIVLGG
jgi:hypothetical protein